MIGLRDVEAARERIHSFIQQTPLWSSTKLSEKTEIPVYLKLEHLQTTGSFKLRGATNAILNLSVAQKKAGVVGVSTGNHGRGLAFAARQADVRCVICMSRLVPQNKINGIKAQGAEIRIVGNSQDEAQVEAEKLAAAGMTMLPPFDHPHIIAGQGTLALEILEQVPDLETVIVPVSGGGLISGISLALKTLRSNVRVIGVSMERGAAMIESQKARKPILVEELPTLADSLGGGIGLDNQYTFQIVRDCVDELVKVTETDIAEAIRFAYWEERQVIEGSGSVGIAAVISERVNLSGPTVLLLSGGNIDMSLHKQVIDGINVDVTTSTS